jgi:hypothetical protein
VKERAKWKQ